MVKQIYMDNSATTPVKAEVLEAMMPYFSEKYGNPSSIYSLGSASKVAVENARNQVAKALGAESKEIFFTAGGSESDNWAIKGVAYNQVKKGNHIITTKIEHHAVLHTCEYLEKKGFEVTYLDVDEFGLIDLEQLKNAIKDETILISIIYANNEIGTIQPIKEIGEIYGPKGIGALYIKQGTRLDTLITGGGQERNKRAGTENVPGIVGLGKAIEIATVDIEAHNIKLIALRERLIEKIEANIPYIRLNGPRKNRLPNNVNFCFEFIEGESLLLSLDLVGIAGSSGSACTSGTLDPSHVLLSIGLPHEIAHGSLRLSLGDFNTEEEVDYVVEHLMEIVERLRQMSPLYDRVKGVK